MSSARRVRNGMGHCVKGCREIEEDENGDEAIVGGSEKVIGDFNESGLSTVSNSEA